MKQIGTNKFIGDDPYFCVLAAKMLRDQNRREIERENGRKRLPPADRFLHLLNERTTKPKKFGFIVDHSYFRFGDNTLISIFKTKELSGVPDCEKFICHLESIYVVDAARGEGCGTGCMRMLKDIAEESGCVIELFCNPFVWSRDGVSDYAVESFDQLWGVVSEPKWNVLYHTDSQKELTKMFYQRMGFVNMCIYGDWVYERDKSEDLPFEQQFAYLPSSLKAEYRQQISERLKNGACEFCCRS